MGQRGLFQPCWLCPYPCPRAATQELALLISRMQANADQVERDILETQKRLQQVRPQGQAAGCECRGGSLKPGVPTGDAYAGTDSPCLSPVIPQTQWERGLSSPFLLDSQWGGLEGLGGPGSPLCPCTHPTDALGLALCRRGHQGWQCSLGNSG